MLYQHRKSGSHACVSVRRRLLKWRIGLSYFLRSDGAKGLDDNQRTSPFTGDWLPATAFGPCRGHYGNTYGRAMQQTGDRIQYARKDQRMVSV